MKQRSVTVRIGIVSFVVGVCLAACGPSSEKTGTQTNWLRACLSNADCGGFECLCGTCSRSCDDDSVCSDLPGAACVVADDSSVIALCGGSAPSTPGLCLPQCPSEGCQSGTSCVAGVCTPTLEPTAHVTIDASQQFQTLLGIGAAVAYMGDELVQHPQKAELFDAMFSDSGLNVLRLRNRFDPQAPDLGGTQEIVDAARQRLGPELMIILNLASPPGSLKANGSTWCEGNPETCTLVKLPDGSFDYAGFASHWRASLDAYAAIGVEPDYISIQNNPNWVPAAGTSIEACRFLPSEGSLDLSTSAGTVTVDYPGYAQALAAVRAQLADLASMPKILAPETTNFPQVAEYAAELDFTGVDAIAHHMYGTDPAALDADALGAVRDLAEQQQRPLFQSEMQADALTTAVLMHASFVLENAAVFVQNGFVGSALSIEPDDRVLINLTPDGFVLGDAYHAMLQYAAHIEPGWLRVSADSDASEVLVSAWLSPTDDGLTIVLINPGITREVVELDNGMSSWATSTVIRTALAGSERSADLGALPTSRTLTMPGHSIVSVMLQR